MPLGRARSVHDQDPVGEEAPQRGLELVMVCIDEPRHHDAPGRVDDAGAGYVQILPNGDDLLAVDQNIALWEVAHRRVHRHDGAAADDVAPPMVASPGGRTRIVGLRGSGRRVQEIEPGSCDRARGGDFQEIAP